MEFLNLGYPIKIRIGDSSDCYWKTIKKNEIVNLPESVGRKLGFKIKTTEGKIGNKVVETKQIETDKPTDDFLNELKSIKGIGKKTAQDIVTWGTKQKLAEAIRSKTSLPFRDDIENKLRKKYG